MEDHRQHIEQSTALLSQRAEVRRLADIIVHEHKASLCIHCHSDHVRDSLGSMDCCANANLLIYLLAHR